MKFYSFNKGSSILLRDFAFQSQINAMRLTIYFVLKISSEKSKILIAKFIFSQAINFFITDWMNFLGLKFPDIAGENLASLENCFPPGRLNRWILKFMQTRRSWKISNRTSRENFWPAQESMEYLANYSSISANTTSSN